MDYIESTCGKIPNWIRWPLIPATSVVSAVIVWLIAGILAKVLVFFAGDRGWGQNFYDYLIVPGFGTYCAVVVGAIMAPRHRQYTALLLSGAWVFAAGWFTFMAILTETWANLIIVISACIGCGIATMKDYAEAGRQTLDSEGLSEFTSQD